MRILVAGIGNIFLGDDGFGVEVVRQLVRHPIPDQVRVADYGIRGYDLAFAMLERYDATILVDATSRGQPPGTVFLLKPAPSPASPEAPADAHGMNPARVLELVQALGGDPGCLYVLGCEPAYLGGEQGHMGLSQAVGDAVPGAVSLLRSLLDELLAQKPGEPI